MEWLRKILDSTKIEDNKLDVDSLMKQINNEFSKNAVMRNEFNTLNEQLKTANSTIRDLEKSNKNNEDLQTKIKDYEEKFSKLEAEAVLKTKEYGLREKLSKLGVTDLDYIIYKHGGIDKFSFDDKGSPIGVEEAIAPYKESMPYIFTDSQKVIYKPQKGKSDVSINPFAKDTFNLTRQGELFRENPIQAKELAAQAGINI